VTSALKSTALSVDFAGQLRHTDTSLAVKGDATYKTPTFGTNKVDYICICICIFTKLEKMLSGEY
jgi:hypothetical protein